MKSYLIGIDIGTGSTKAVAIDTRGEVLSTAQITYPTLVPQPGFSEQEPEILWQAFLTCLKKIVDHLQQQPDAIALSSAMHSIIPVDKHGNPLMNMITWADNRSSEIAARIKHSSLGEVLYEQTGTPLHAMSPLFKIIWLKENQPALFARIAKFISIKEYIWFRLFQVFEVDHSIASACGLFDIETLSWNTNALNLCEITSEKLSTPKPTSHQRSGLKKDIAQALGLAENTPFVIGASDGCMANLGSFATQPGIAALTIGTSGAIRVSSTTPTFNFGAMTFNYVLDENTFISGGPINNGGIALKWYVESFLKRKLTSPADYDEIMNDIQPVNPGADGLIFLPYILGERAPLWNSQACGAFFGITASHTQAHFTRAVVEGISLALYNIAQTLAESGLTIDQINVSGGFVHAENWLQILADIFGKPIVLVREEDASAIGAAYLGMKTLRLITDYQSLKPKNSRTFTPNPDNHTIYRNVVFPMFRSLTKNLTLDMEIRHEMKISYSITNS